MAKSGFFSRALLMCIVTGLFLLPAPAAAADDDLLITLDFQNVELADMIGTISELTGKNFLYDETVRGKVTILSPQPVSLDEAYHLFTTVLRVKGFTIVPAGKVNKIVALATAREETLPFSVGRGLGEQHVTRILELKNLDAQVVVETVLRPLMPKTSHIVAHQATNAVVVTDSSANIDRLARLLNALDRTWDNDRIELVSLQYAEVVETAAVVMQMLEGDSSAAPVRGAAARQAQTRKRVAGQIIPYERTSTLMLQGDQAFIEQAKRLIAHLDIKAELGRSGVHVYYLEHAEAEPLAETLNRIVAGATRPPTQAVTARQPQEALASEILKGVTITADKPTNALVINATAEEYVNVQALIQQLDIKRKQVFVEALIMELSMAAVLELGASLQGAIDLGDDSLIFGASNAADAGGGFLSSQVPSVLTQAVNGILLGGLFNPITTVINGQTITVPALSALINLSQVDSDVNVLSAPRLLTSDNEEAEIIVGENVPIITSRSETIGGSPISTVERQDAALILRFTPQITEGDLVRMKIHQEISDVKATGGVGNENEIGPTLTKTLLRNTIVARDGETVVLGGLFKNTITASTTKVPFLGDIPILGHLFKRSSNDERKTSLLIFITPRVIRDSEDLKRVTRDSQLDLELYRSEGGSDKFFEGQTQRRSEDTDAPVWE